MFSNTSSFDVLLVVTYKKMFCSNFHIGKAHLVPFGLLYKEFSFDCALLVVTYGKMSLSTFHICVASFFHEQR